jgi:hypothetical protein
MNFKLLAILIAVLGTLSVLYTQYNDKPELSPFEAWKAQYGVKYDSMFEEAYRHRVFLENLAKVKIHNS